MTFKLYLFQPIKRAYMAREIVFYKTIINYGTFDATVGTFTNINNGFENYGTLLPDDGII
jgi:hypothetical protein